MSPPATGRRWYVVTGEYPPAMGGVSDYTCSLVGELSARGETVEVFAPGAAGREGQQEQPQGVVIHWLAGRYGLRALISLKRALRDAPAGTVLLQYVPHAFGWKAMNIGLCLLLAHQRRHSLWVMFHEVAYPLEWRNGLPKAILGLVNRWMARKLVKASKRVFVSTPAWQTLLASIQGKPVKAIWAPVPSNFEGIDEKLSAAEHFAPLPSDWEGKRRIIGHFGSFGKLVTEILGPIVVALLRESSETRFVFIGRSSRQFAESLERRIPSIRNRILATGELEPEEIVRWVRACSLLIQPFPDGVTTRRSSVMCALALGGAVITQAGTLTEPVWHESGAVRLVGSDPRQWVAAVESLLESPTELAVLRERARDLYSQMFSLARTATLLLDDGSHDELDGPWLVKSGRQILCAQDRSA